MKITTITKYAHITHADAAAAEAEHGRFFRFEVFANDCPGPAWKIVCAEKTWPPNQNRQVGTYDHERGRDLSWAERNSRALYEEITGEPAKREG